jgi:hypothetical protein
MGVSCTTYGSEERCIKVLVRKPDGNRQFEIPSRRLEDYIKVELQEVRWRHGLD